MDHEKHLRIAILTDTYYPAMDGVVRNTQNLRDELERRGHDVYIFTAGNKETKRLAAKDKKLFVFRGLTFWRYKQYTLSTNIVSINKIGKLNPDIIHSQTPFSIGLLGLLASRKYHIPIISTFHTFITSEDMIGGYLNKNKTILRLLQKFLVWYMRFFYSRSRLIIAPSKYSRGILVNEGIKNTVVVPNGIHLPKKVSKSYARRMIGVKKGEKIILYIGRLGHEKNLDFLLSTADRLGKSGINLIIAGSGPALPQLKDYVSTNKLQNVRFPGFVKEDKKDLYYRAADVFVNPSRVEILSTVDIEAMSNGTPILVPAGSSQEEFLEDGKCGEKFDLNDPDDFVTKLNMILAHPNRYRPLKCADQYSLKNSVDRLLKVYYSVLKSNR